MLILPSDRSTSTPQSRSAIGLLPGGNSLVGVSAVGADVLPDFDDGGVDFTGMVSWPQHIKKKVDSFLIARAGEQQNSSPL